MQSLKLPITILILLFPIGLFSQSFKANLSPKHEQKLSSIKSGHKRMLSYYRFYKKDSAGHVKKKTKQAKREWDSLRRAEASADKITKELTARGIVGDNQIRFANSLQNQLQRYSKILKDSSQTDSAKQMAKQKIKEISKDKVNSQLAKNGHPYQTQFKEAEGMKNELKKWWAMMKDTTASDSSRKVAKGKVKELVLAQAIKNPQFNGIFGHYKQFGKKPSWKDLNDHVPGMDSLQGIFDSTPEEFMDKAGSASEAALTHAGGLGIVPKQAGEFDKLKDQYNGLSNPDSLKKLAKKQVVDHFAQQGDQLKAAQQKMNGLLTKYKEFTDSNDLSTAVKRTSLKGKTFKEHLVLGGNFNVVSTAPFSIDFAPLVGYKFNTKFYVGVGINYRFTFSDSLRYKTYVSPSNTSGRLFASYDLIKNFFAYTEVEAAGLKVRVKESIAQEWRINYFIGLGKKLLIHPKLFMTITAIYNLNGEKNNPTYPQKFQIRLGFQTSDLAFRKKKVYYNPY